MIKKVVLSLALLVAPAYLHAITLKSEILPLVDGTIVGWDSVLTIKQYQKKIKHYLKEYRTVDGVELKLFDLAIKEKNGNITDAEKAVFEEFVQKFVEFSEPFIITLNPVKNTISSLIKESCQHRNREHSLLIVWTHSEDGTERAMFSHHIKTYRALAELCMDLLNFTEDLLSSCPKATKLYHDFFDRLSKIEPLVDALLVADQVTVSHHGVLYYDLVRYITEHYSHEEDVTAEKTTKLYNTYNIKKRL